MTKSERALSALAAGLLAMSALCLWVLPGVRFSGYLSVALAALCVLVIPFARWGKRSRAGKLCWRSFLVALTVGAFLFLTVEGLLLFHGQRDNRAIPADAVIVLGAGVNGQTPSLILQSRIDVAADYLHRHPEIPAVLSGGQGPGEDITEAEAMRRGLLNRGIAPERLLLEAASTSTAENLAFSKEVLKGHGLETDTAVIAVVTSDFHCLRAHWLAQREGLSVLDIPAEAPWPYLSGNYYVREFFALGKTVLFG